MIGPVHGRLAQHDAGHAADGEQDQEAEGEEHRRLELDRAAPHGRDPGEDLDPRGHRDDHRGQHEIGLLAQRHAHRVHVVRPDDEAQRPDRDQRPDHRQVAEDRLAREGGDHVGDQAEAGQDHDIHFRVAEEPQDVLVQHRVAAAGRVEEGEAEVAVHQQHGDRARQNRKGQKDQPGGDEDRPGEERHLEQGHARRAHVQEGGDHVDRAQDRACARDVDGEDRQVHGHAAFERRERRVEHPAHARAQLVIAARRQQRGHAQRGAGHVEPEGQVVHAREGHARRADLQRHEIVAETAEQCRDHHEEHHQDAVIGDQHVPQMAVRRAFRRGVREQPRAFEAHVLHARVHQLEPHVDGEAHRDEAGQGRDDEIQDPDIFVVGGHEPSREEAAIVLMPVNGRVCHRGASCQNLADGAAMGPPESFRF